ncbi:hypothetical protein PENSPDRAFT_212492 [Peniophora sp. CONT]|nr:hypothetical protein PENSPDRAFT_212492 [Peniophora sp. CONT]
MPPVLLPPHGRSAAPAGPTSSAAPPIAASGSAIGSTLAERNRQKAEMARASRKARLSKLAVADPNSATPQANETPRAAPASTRLRSPQLDNEPRHHVTRAPASPHTPQAASPKAAPANLPSTTRASKPSSRRPRSALLPGDSSPVRLTTYPPNSSPTSDGEESEDDGKRRPTTPSPEDWPATQSSTHSSPQPMPSSNAWMQSSPDPPSPGPSPHKASSHPSRRETIRTVSSSTSGSSTSRAQSPKSSTGSLTMQGKRHAPEPPPVPPPGTQEKVLVPNSDTSLSLSQGLSQEKGGHVHGGPSKGGERGRGTKVRVRAEREPEEKARVRQVDGVGERKRRRLDISGHSQRSPILNAEGDEARMPGHFSPADADSEVVEALIGSDSRPNATTARYSRQYPDLGALSDEDDRQILAAARNAADKGKGKARVIKTTVDEPAPEQAPSPHLHNAKDEAPYVKLREITGSNKRKQPIRSSNFADFLERPSKKARTADEKGKAPERQVESKGTTSVEVSSSRGASSSTPVPLISWIPDDPPYPPSQLEEDARARAKIREMSALVEQRRRGGRPHGEELTKEEERKFTLISGKIKKPSKR